MQLPGKLREGLQRQLASSAVQHREDIELEAGWAWMPYALAEKNPESGHELGWQCLFPGKHLIVDPVAEADEPGLMLGRGRLHWHESSIQKAVRPAVKQIASAEGRDLSYVSPFL